MRNDALIDDQMVSGMASLDAVVMNGRGGLQVLFVSFTKGPGGHHSIQTGHTTNQNNFQIIGREGQNLARNIKESIYIRVNNPSLNNNIGKFNLSHIWDRVLLNTKGLTLK